MTSKILALSFVVLAIIVSTSGFALAEASDASPSQSAKQVKTKKSVSKVKKSTSKKSSKKLSAKLSATSSSKTSSKSSQTAIKSAGAADEPIRPASGTKLSREIVFDGSNVNGQYHSAGEAVAKVEQEKKMNRLIGIRADYKDRMSAERERLKRGEDVHSND